MLNSNELFPVFLTLEGSLFHLINSSWLLLSFSCLFLLLFLWGDGNLAVILKVFSEIQEHHSTFLDIFRVINVDFHVETEDLMSLEELLSLSFLVFHVVVRDCSS
jgi:hypothetical protein